MIESRSQAYAERSFESIYRLVRPAVCLAATLTALAPAPAVRAGSDGLIRIEVADTLDAAPELVRLTLLDLDAFKSWFPALGDWRVMSRDASSAVVYGSQSLPWPVDDRDYVVRYRWWTGGDQTFHLEARALAGAAPAPTPGRVRVEHMRTEWTVRADEAGTYVVYVYEGTPGVPLPAWVMRIGWESQTKRLIRALAEELERRVAAAP